MKTLISTKETQFPHRIIRDCVRFIMADRLDISYDKVQLLRTLMFEGASVQELLINGSKVQELLAAGVASSSFIGLAAGGGIIYYVDAISGYVLVAAPMDQSEGAAWADDDFSMAGAKGNTIGYGAKNTIEMEGRCTTANTAAGICANLNLGGYNDWFLPSKDELSEMYYTIGPGAQNIGGFKDDFDSEYWTSSERLLLSASIKFQNYEVRNQMKGELFYVRATRVLN